MNDRSTLEWLSDARDHALEADNLAAGFTREVLDEDRRTLFAVCFCLAVVGEALNQVPKDVRAIAPEIAWAPIIGLRNRLVHSYWLSDTATILQIAQADARVLASSIDRLMKKLS
jgi:uncharacterized protein with HEPN domain